MFGQRENLISLEFIRDSSYIGRLVKLSNELNCDSLIKIGEEFHLNPHRIPGPYIDIITNNVIGNLCVKGKPLSKGQIPTKELYTFLLYRKIQEVNGVYNYDAARADYQAIVSDPLATIELLKSQPIDKYSFRSLCTLTELQQSRMAIDYRWSIMYLTDSIYNSIKGTLDSSSIGYFNDLKRYYCQIGQFNCDTAKTSNTSKHIAIQNLRFNEVNIDTTLDYFDQLLVFTDDTFSIPNYIEINVFINYVSYLSYTLEHTENEKLRIALYLLDKINDAEKTYGNIMKELLWSLNDSIFNNANRDGQSKKYVRQMKKSLKAQTTSEISDYLVESSFLAYRSKFLLLLLRDYLASGTGTLVSVDYRNDQNSSTYAVIDSLHDELMSSFESQINPLIIGNFFDALIDTSSWKSQAVSNIIEAGIKKRSNNLLLYLISAVKSIVDQQAILNIYNVREIENLFLSNLNKYTLAVLRGAMSNSTFTKDKVSLSLRDEFGANLLRLLIEFRALNNISLNRNLVREEVKDNDFTDICLLISDEYNNSYSLFIDNDSIHLRSIIFPKELIDYRNGSIGELVNKLNNSFKDGDTGPYISFTWELINNIPELFKTSSTKYIIAEGEFSRVNWAIVSDGSSGYFKEKHSLIKTISFVEKQKIMLPDIMDIVAISNLNYQAGTLNVGSGSFGQTRGERSGKYWTELPGTSQETKAILEHFPNESILLQEITKERLNYALVNSSIVHVASHADFDRNVLGHNSAYIVLDSANYFEDKFDSISPQAYYTIGDIRMNNRKFQSLLVVLSACNSGMGKTVTNTYSVNLPSILLAKGTKSVIASFWEVSDTFGALFFDYFYNDLSKTRNIVSAFENTRWHFRDQGTDPRLTYSFDIILR